MQTHSRSHKFYDMYAIYNIFVLYMLICHSLRPACWQLTGTINCKIWPKVTYGLHIFIDTSISACVRVCVCVCVRICEIHMYINNKTQLQLQIFYAGDAAAAAASFEIVPSKDKRSSL